MCSNPKKYRSQKKKKKKKKQAKVVTMALPLVFMTSNQGKILCISGKIVHNT